jgi:hypothetical protein
LQLNVTQRRFGSLIDHRLDDGHCCLAGWEQRLQGELRQLRRPNRRAWHEALPIVLKQERDITIWEPLRADRKQI